MLLPLPVHFFTIVLNGQPFISHHLSAFQKLPFPWHWHIIEGVAELKHDTAWSVASGGRIPEQLHREGRSVDGTTEYLDALTREAPDQVSVYRKPPGVFWDGKLEMVNAPLAKIQSPCLLWQVDSDELWSTEQICVAHALFSKHPEKTAAFYLCHYYVGEKLVITSRNTYGNHLEMEWLRTWRFEPGMRWTAHEPPRLCREKKPGEWEDVATINPLRHDITEAAGLVFQHFAYAIEPQLQFKEFYYGYANAVAEWRRLQEATKFPVRLGDFFHWVTDEAQVNTVASQGIAPIAQKNILGQWRFQSADRGWSPAAAGVLPPTLNTRPGTAPTAAAGDQPRSGDPARILWARLDSIGDNVLAASMLPHIRERYPQATLTVFCQEHIAELYAACPHVDEIVTIDLERARADKKYLEHFNERWGNYRPDLVLNSVFSREPFTDQLLAATGAPIRIAFMGDLSNMNEEERTKNRELYHRLLESDVAPAAEFRRHLDFLRGLGIAASSLQPLAWTTKADEEFAEDFFRTNSLDQPLALFPGAQWDCKLYDHFTEALAVFGEHSLLVLGGKREEQRAGEFSKSHPGPTWNLAGKTTLRQMTALLRRCCLLITTDSAGAHLAAAVGTPQVVVLGGGHFGRFLPYSASTSVVCLPLNCYHCNWVCKHPTPYCIKDIAPEVVAGAISDTLARRASKPRVFVQSHTGAGYSPAEPQAVELPIDFLPKEIEIIREEVPPPPRNWPMITVISAITEAESSTADAIRSIKQQAYPYCELLGMRDSSAPASESSSFAPGLDRRNGGHDLWPMVRLLNLPGQSLPQDANHLLNAAKGEIITWLNPGETFEPDAFRAVAAFFRTYPERDIVTGGTHLGAGEGEEGVALAGGRFVPQTSAVFFRRRLLERFGRLDESLNQTAWLDFCLRLARKTSFWHLPTVLIRRSAHSAGRDRRGLSPWWRDDEQRQVYRRHWPALLRHNWSRFRQAVPPRRASLR